MTSPPTLMSVQVCDPWVPWHNTSSWVHLSSANYLKIMKSEKIQGLEAVLTAQRKISPFIARFKQQIRIPLPLPTSAGLSSAQLLSLPATLLTSAHHLQPWMTLQHLPTSKLLHRASSLQATRRESRMRSHPQMRSHAQTSDTSFRGALCFEVNVFHMPLQIYQETQ